MIPYHAKVKVWDPPKMIGNEDLLTLLKRQNRDLVLVFGESLGADKGQGS